MNENIAIGIIIYNPGSSVLIRIEETIRSGYKVYIFDNSPDSGIIRDYVKSDAADASMITYLTCGKNAGLGYGLAAVCSHAYYDSFPALLFFDQDTVYSAQTLDYISHFFLENRALPQAYSSVVFNSKNADKPGPQGNAVTDVPLAINSGSLYFLDNLKKMNWHSTKYFVDCVDYEFCMSSRRFHFKIGEHSYTPGFDHCSEQWDTLYKVFGKVLPMRPYPCSRIRDSYFASVKLVFKSISTGNFAYTVIISSAIHKYLFVQFYVRIAKLFHIRKAVNK